MQSHAALRRETDAQVSRLAVSVTISTTNKIFYTIFTHFNTTLGEPTDRRVLMKMTMLFDGALGGHLAKIVRLLVLLDRVACWTTPGDVHGLLGNAALEHVDMLVVKGSPIYNTMITKSGIDNALLSAADPLLQSFMKLDDRGGFFKQADMEHDLLFAIRARGYEERWRAQGHDISKVSYKIRVMLSHFRQKNGFKATANTCKTSVTRLATTPFLAFRNNAAEDDVSEERGVAWDENGDCFPADTYREDGAFATAVWHREDVPATWIADDTIQKQGLSV